VISRALGVWLLVLSTALLGQPAEEMPVVYGREDMNANAARVPACEAVLQYSNSAEIRRSA